VNEKNVSIAGWKPAFVGMPPTGFQSIISIVKKMTLPGKYKQIFNIPVWSHPDVGNSIRCYSRPGFPGLSGI